MIFDQELRERNSIHHHQRFEDIRVNRISMTEMFVKGEKGKQWERDHLKDYRRYTKEWVIRVRKRGAQMDRFLEAIASATLDNCDFLSQEEASSSDFISKSKLQAP